LSAEDLESAIAANKEARRLSTENDIAKDNEYDEKMRPFHDVNLSEY